MEEKDLALRQFDVDVREILFSITSKLDSNTQRIPVYDSGWYDGPYKVFEHTYGNEKFNSVHAFRDEVRKMEDFLNENNAPNSAIDENIRLLREKFENYLSKNESYGFVPLPQE